MLYKYVCGEKSDMTVVAAGSQSHLSLAQQISGNGPMPNCTSSDEESYEPNDSAMMPATIAPGVNFDGGICTPNNADWYLIDHAGGWTLDLTFTHATGDLDVYVFPESNFDPNNPSAASESYDDNEQVSSMGRSSSGRWIPGRDDSIPPPTDCYAVTSWCPTSIL